ncbi:alpha/beta fold hydrolase [Amycolatopsis sp. ATCC 39116]|uniref:alpha/beta fold hydrolase n=1 Tax=Amycolatopsis TaxID=1813 RepID=UPI00026265D9|nr:hypothetical protein [Amycolatopsis sp. ATCC 39116]
MLDRRFFEGAGHFPHHTAPQRFLAVLRDFLATTRPAQHDVRRWRELLRTGRSPGSGGSTPLGISSGS